MNLVLFKVYIIGALSWNIKEIIDLEGLYCAVRLGLDTKHHVSSLNLSSAF